MNPILKLASTVIITFCGLSVSIVAFMLAAVGIFFAAIREAAAYITKQKFEAE